MIQNNDVDHTLVPSSKYNEAMDGHPSKTLFAISRDSKNIYIGYGGIDSLVTIEREMTWVIPFGKQVKGNGEWDYNTFRVTHDLIKVKYTGHNASPDGKHLLSWHSIRYT